MNNTEKNASDEKENHDLTFLPILNSKYAIFASQIRLSIMLILNSQKKVKVTELLHLFGMSSGKLEHHITILEKDNLVNKKMDFYHTRINSTIEITKEGKKLLDDYLGLIKEIIKKIEL